MANAASASASPPSSVWFEWVEVVSLPVSQKSVAPSKWPSSRPTAEAPTGEVSSPTTT